jgi:hypothetical protein
MPSPIFAHLGHWYVSLPVFMGPALLLIVFLKFQAWRERREGSRPSGKHSRVTASRVDAQTVVAVDGPLDYPALVEIQVELGRAESRSPELILDLCGVTRAEEDSVWQLCDIIGRSRSEESSVSVLVRRDQAMQPFLGTFATEGVRTILTSPPSAHAASS